MSEFEGYLCWRPEVVSSTVATEAVSPSDQVFLATHTPLQIRRLRRGRAHASSDTISERELLREFLESRPKEGIVVAAVLGESGSGKSHLVRWAKAHIQDDDRRIVLYLPKTKTSLRDVVNALMMGQTGGVFDEIRAQMARLGESISQESLQRRMLNELAEALTTARETDPFRRPLVGERGLPVLMLDPLFRSHMLREGAFISRRAEHALRGRAEMGGDLPLEFGIADLPLDIANVTQLEHAGRAAQQLFRKLSTNQQMQQAAVALLNENLDIAVTRASHLGVGDIHRAFLALRERFVEREIVLLIEDFALIQGVRRDLLDAIVEAGVVGGKQKYATVRTLMAVTTGYYGQLDETFRTRAEASSPRYQIDIRLSGDDAVPAQSTVDFVAKYLNVARLGESGLAQRGTAANACEGCAFLDPCHTGFGASRDGYGLYPYNSSALLRAVQASAPDEHADSFIPRAVLSRVVRDVLIGQAHSLSEGTFPGKAFKEGLPTKPGTAGLAISDRRTLEHNFTGPELDRRITFLEFWGGSQGLVNLNPVVHQAFRITPLSDSMVTATDTGTSTGAGTDRRTGTGTGEGVSATLARDIENIQAWLDGTALTQEVSRQVRSIVMDAVLSRATWMSPPMRAEGGVVGRAFPRTAAAQHVSIEGAREGRAGDARPPIVFARSAVNAQFFIELLSARQGLMAGSRPALARLERMAERNAPHFQALLVTKEELTDGHLAAAIRSLLKGAALCGHLSSEATSTADAEAVFWNGEGPDRTDTAWRVPVWLDTERRYRSQRAEAVGRLRDALGLAQGATGGVHAIDTERLARLVRMARSSEELPVPTWALGGERARRQLEGLAAAQAGHWDGLCRQIRHHIPAEASFRETVTAVVAAAREGSGHGFVPAQLDQVQSRNAGAQGLDFSSVTQVERLVLRARQSDGLDQALAIGTDVGPGPAGVLDYLTWTSEWIDSGLRRAEAQAGDTTNDLDHRIRALLDTWLDLGGES